MEKQHIRLLHRKEESTEVYAAGKTRNVPGNTTNAWNTGYIGGNIIGNAGGCGGNGWNIYGSNEIVDKYEKAKKEENQHNRVEPMTELRAVARRTVELHKRPAGKNDQEQGYRHKIKKETAAAGALGGGGHVLHKHHAKKDYKKEEKGLEGKKYHHRF